MAKIKFAEVVGKQKNEFHSSIELFSYKKKKEQKHKNKCRETRLAVCNLNI